MHPQAYFGKTGVRRTSAMIRLDKTLVSSCGLSIVTVPL